MKELTPEQLRAAKEYAKSQSTVLVRYGEITDRNEYNIVLLAVKEVINNPERYGLKPIAKFKVSEIRDLLNQVTKEEISFSRFVEIINEGLKPIEE